MNEALRNRLNDTAIQAVGHFMLGWGEEDAPAIINPWKHRYTDKRYLDQYPDFSELILDYEYSLASMLNGGELDDDVIDTINNVCIELESDW